MNEITYHAFEIDTSNITLMGAYTDVAEANEAFAKSCREIGMSNIETYLLGTVRAMSLDEALDKMRADDWEYTQRV